MTDLNTRNTRPLSGAHETREEFTGTGTDVRIGIEAEYQIYDPENGFKPITIAQNAAFEAVATANGLAISHEASAQTIEIKTDAYRHTDFSSLCDEFNAHYTAFKAVVKEAGFESVNVPLLPQASFAELLEQIHPRERAQVFLRHFEDHDALETARYFTSVSGLQASISYADEQHGWDIYRRAVYLAPLLATVLSNCPSVLSDDAGELTAVTRNETLARRLAPYGREGGVAEAFWTSDNATAFFDAVNEGVWNAPLFCAYDGEGALQYFADAADVKSLNDLDESYKTRANYDLAASIQWHLVSVSLLPQKDGSYKRRIEARYFDTLEPEHGLAVTQFLSALAFDKGFGQAIDRFLDNHGFDAQSPARSRGLWQQSLDSAIEDGYATPQEAVYGTASVLEASEALAAIVKPYVNDYPHLAPLYGILRDCNPPKNTVGGVIADQGLDAFLRNGRDDAEQAEKASFSKARFSRRNLSL